MTNPSEVSTFIQTVGFPIFSFIVLALYIYWKDKETSKRIESLEQTYNEKIDKMQSFCIEMQSKYTEEAKKVLLALDNNTDALEKLSAKIDKEVINNESVITR